MKPYLKKTTSAFITLAASAATISGVQAAAISVETATTVNFTSAGTGPSGAFTEYVWNGGTSTYTSGSANGDQRLVEGVALTFNIDPGVTVSGGRFFIGTIDNNPNSITVGPAIWNISGGGEMRITRTGTFNLRLGQNGGTPAVSEAGQVVISGGSSLVMTTGAFQEQAGSLITLNGFGSSFTANGTWDAINNRFAGQTSGTAGVLNSGAINFAFSGSGVTGINALSNAGVVTLTAVPEPASALLGGIGLLALLRRRRA